MDNKKKYCLDIEYSENESLPSLLRFPSSSLPDSNYFNPGEKHIGSNWGKAITQQMKPIRVKLLPSTFPNWFSLLSEKKEMIVAQYKILKAYTTLEVEKSKFSNVHQDITRSVIKTSEMNQLEDISTLSEQLIEVISAEENPLSLLVNMMDGAASAITFCATVITLLRRNISPTLIAESSFLARFLELNATEISVVHEAYHLLQVISDSETDKIKSDLFLLNSLANLYSISFTVSYRDSLSTSIRGFERISLSGIISEAPLHRRICVNYKTPFSLTPNEHNWKKLYSFFNIPFLLSAIKSDEEEWLKIFPFFSHSAQHFTINTVIDLYTTVNAFNEHDKIRCLKRLSISIKLDEMLNMLEAAVASEENSVQIFDFFPRAVTISGRSISITEKNINMIMILSGDNGLLPCNQTILNKAIFGFYLEHPELMKLEELSLYFKKRAFLWEDNPNIWAELTSQLKAYVCKNLDYPLTQHAYNDLIDEYRRCFYPCYQLLKLVRRTRSGMVYDHEDGLRGLIISLLYEKLGDSFHLKSCLDIFFYYFDLTYLEPKQKLKVREKFIIYCLNGAGNLKACVTKQLGDFFEPLELWSFLQTKRGEFLIWDNVCYPINAFLPILPMLCIGKSNGLSIQDLWKFLQATGFKKTVYFRRIAINNNGALELILNALKIGTPDGVTREEFWEFLKAKEKDDDYPLIYSISGHEVSFKSTLDALQLGEPRGISIEQVWTYFQNNNNLLNIIADWNFTSFIYLANSLKLGEVQGITIERLWSFLHSKNNNIVLLYDVIKRSEACRAFFYVFKINEPSGINFNELSTTLLNLTSVYNDAWAVLNIAKALIDLLPNHLAMIYAFIEELLNILPERTKLNYPTSNYVDETKKLIGYSIRFNSVLPPSNHQGTGYKYTPYKSAVLSSIEAYLKECGTMLNWTFHRKGIAAVNALRDNITFITDAMLEAQVVTLHNTLGPTTRRHFSNVLDKNVYQDNSLRAVANINSNI